MKRTQKALGHNVPSTEMWIYDVMPENLEDSIIVISTVWDDKSGKGQTMVSVIKTRSWWDLEKDYGNVIKQHSDKKEAYQFFRKTVKEKKGLVKDG